MNFQQLEYIIAVDKYRHFVSASEACFVTQPTLSMMIQKLEDELDVKIFDRSRQPVIPTEMGSLLIEQARVILNEAQQMKEIISQARNQIKGVLHIGIIPTLAPYMIPLFAKKIANKYPELSLFFSEMTTMQIEKLLQNGDLDAGIFATPAFDLNLKYEVLFYEQFKLFAPRREKESDDIKSVDVSEIDHASLWLLNEGHCLTAQVKKWCGVKGNPLFGSGVVYETGNLETLKKLVTMHHGMTLLPELMCWELSESDKQHLYELKPEVPGREISLVTYRHFAKRRLLEILKSEIISVIPPDMQLKSRLSVVAAFE